MGIIQFKETNCKHCYKCVRKCSIKSIAFKNEQAQIIDEECILCGQCFLVCPQNAKYIKSDLYGIKNYLKRGEKVYASLAPSYAAAFHGAEFANMSAALKRLGFTGVEETAIGAGKVSREYERLLESHTMDNMITTCCPTVNLLMQKYYPELLPYAAPVLSPAIAHGKMLREVYGEKIRVVFIGPCISKKYEADHSGVVNATLMFDELYDWLEEEGIDFTQKDENPSEMHGVVNRLYPVPGGILDTMSKESMKDYKTIAVDGINRCIQMLDALKSHQLTGYFIEMSACPGSCSYGPALKDYDKPLLVARDEIWENALKTTLTSLPLTEENQNDISFDYESLAAVKPQPTKEEIQRILESMGKASPSELFNCGACGYDTCKEKAVAVWQGKAEVKMCVPFMWSKMESLSNVVMENTPNGVIVVNKEFDIVEYNKAAVDMFGLKEFTHVGLPLQMLIDTTHMEEAASLGNNLYDEVQLLLESGKTVEVTLVKSSDESTFIVFVKDITKDMEQKEKMALMREETLETAQRVIDKQMRVAQEIASLLGETTGETKVALTNLKKSISQSDGLDEAARSSKG